MITLSHLANVLIIAAVTGGLWRNLPAMTDAFGPDTTARRILGCLYATIGLISLYALIQTAFGNAQIAMLVGAMLFPLQIVYKVLTAVFVGPTHPVVMANMVVVALHCMTLLVAY